MNIRIKFFVVLLFVLLGGCASSVAQQAKVATATSTSSEEVAFQQEEVQPPPGVFSCRDLYKQCLQQQGEEDCEQAIKATNGCSDWQKDPLPQREISHMSSSQCAKLRKRAGSANSKEFDNLLKLIGCDTMTDNSSSDQSPPQGKTLAKEGYRVVERELRSFLPPVPYYTITVSNDTDGKCFAVQPQRAVAFSSGTSVNGKITAQRAPMFFSGSFGERLAFLPPHRAQSFRATCPSCVTDILVYQYTCEQRPRRIKLRTELELGVGGEATTNTKIETTVSIRR